ncbi:MAG: PspC domain-containing protein, partial [Candidatus Aminicenantes bacterium]|nr:PspC domain-containing protein [Candidatus Aminicenantes bacterium]
KLYKSRENKVIDGVCGGIAEYFDADPVLIRIIFVLFFFFGGSAILAYIIGIVIMPVRPSEQKVKSKSIEDDPSPTPSNKNTLLIGFIFIIIGIFFLMGNIPFFNIYYYWIKKHFWDILLPSILILIGISIVIKSSSEK